MHSNGGCIDLSSTRGCKLWSQLVSHTWQKQLSGSKHYRNRNFDPVLFISTQMIHGDYLTKISIEITSRWLTNGYEFYQ